MSVLAAVTLGGLVELVWQATVITLGLVTVFALGIRGTIEAGDLRRGGRPGAALAAGVAAALCHLAVATAVVLGLLVIATG